MRETQRGKRFIVIDDFLSADDLTTARQLMERATFTQVESVIAPGTDGPALRSPGVTFGQDLGGGGRPRIYEEVGRMVRRESGLFGTAGRDWDRIALAFWKYPVGSRLSWHNDAGRGRTGEFILFLHQRWRPSWAGELLLVDEGQDTPVDLEDHAARMEAMLDNCASSPVAIFPKPNRLVLVQAATLHTIQRVDPTAGQALRRTLTGFVWQTQDDRWAARERLVRVLTG